MAARHRGCLPRNAGRDAEVTVAPREFGRAPRPCRRRRSTLSAAAGRDPQAHVLPSWPAVAPRWNAGCGHRSTFPRGQHASSGRATPWLRSARSWCAEGGL